MFKKITEPVADTTLDTTTFYTMPRPGARVGVAMPQSKKWGLLIVGVGGVALASGVVVLVWYVFFASTAVPAVTTPLPTTSGTEQSAPPTQAVRVDTEADTTTVETNIDSDDLSERACGAVVLAGVSADDEGLTCVGERILDDCKRAAATIDSLDVREARLAVLGSRQDKCLVQLTYPSVSLIAATDLHAYANTYVRCSYDMSDVLAMSETPVQLATYVYEQTSVANLTSGRTCEGSAFTLWQERVGATPSADQSQVVVAGVDTDGDGLTDVEENTIFATSATIADTDNDGYADGIEVRNGYNPAGGGTLAESGLVSEYRNETYDYRLLYPVNWRVEDAADGVNTIFFAAVGGFVQVIAQEAAGASGIAQWYRDSGVGTTTPTVTTSAAGHEVLYSQNGLTAYVMPTGSDTVYVITYSLGESARRDFDATWQMFINTLRTDS